MRTEDQQGRTIRYSKVDVSFCPQRYVASATPCMPWDAYRYMYLLKSQLMARVGAIVLSYLLLSFAMTALGAVASKSQNERRPLRIPLQW